jgi:hypothetical protein
LGLDSYATVISTCDELGIAVIAYSCVLHQQLLCTIFTMF